MFGTRMLRSLAAMLAAVLVVFSYSSRTVAQSTDADTQARMRSLQQQLDELQKQLQSLKDQQAKAAADQQKIAADQQKMAADQAKVTAQSAKTAKTVSTTGKAFDTFMKGFFGTLDVSIDYTTKGMNGFVAYPYSLAPGVTSPTGPFVQGPAKGGGGGTVRARGLACGHVQQRLEHRLSGHASDRRLACGLHLSGVDRDRHGGRTGSAKHLDQVLEYRAGSHRARRYLPRLPDTKSWGKLKFGEMYMPYKTSTDRLNPFSGTLGNYSVIMGNTGRRQPCGVRHPHGSRDPVQLAHLVRLQLRCRLRAGSERGPEQRSHPGGVAGLRRRRTTRAAATCS